MLDKHLAMEALDAALSTGGDFAEIFAEDRRDQAVALQDSRVERVNSGRLHGAGVRVYDGTSAVYAYTNDFGREGLLKCAKEAASAIRAQRQGRTAVQPMEERHFVNRHPIWMKPSEVDTRRKIDVLRAADKAARSAGEELSQVLCAFTDSEQNVLICNSDGQVEEENKQVGLLIKKRVAGIVVAASGNEASYYEKCQLSKIPVAFVDNMITSTRRYLGISVDNALISYNLTRHLLKIGHRRIATITGRLEDNTAADRLNGFRRAIEEIGLTVDERLIVQGEFGSKSSGYEAAKLLLALPEEQRPTAVLAQNNHIAFGAYAYLREQKLKAPRDISIACFDAIDLSGLMKPRLTCYIQPARQFGEIAAQKLLDEIEGRISSAATVGRILLDAAFVKGGSCAELEQQ